jgi:predicted ATP-grasp superfamily ATP-dependent carboligase
VNEFSGQSVLLASSVRWPLTAKLALGFLRHGCKVDVVCPPDHPVSFVGGIHKRFVYRGLHSLESLSDAIIASDPDLVIPCDDGVVRQLHKLYETKPELRPLITRSLGSPEGYASTAGRAELIEVAKEVGIRVPRTKKVTSEQQLKEWFSRPGAAAVMKLDWTCGGKGVEIVRSLEDAQRAMASMRRPATAMTALGRWLLIHDSLAWWKWKNQGTPVLTVQEFIPGRPANTMMACRDGKVLATVTVEVLYAQSCTGTALVVRLTENAEIRQAAELIAQRLKLSGFHGLDFVLEEETEHAYLIELNPRCTQLGNLSIPNQGDLVGVLCGSFPGGNAIRNRSSIQEETVAFFPEALYAKPRCPHLNTSYVDVPWDEPRLVVELMRGDWRDRILLAKLYRALWPQKKTAVVFDPPIARSMPEVEATLGVAR